MLQYTLKRILMMVPVFFLISLLVFLLLNLAPGRPGASGSSETAQAAQVASESVLLFKQQFNFDKPILLNTRFLLDTPRVRDLLVTAYALEGDPPASARIAAKESLEDSGNYLVSPLIPLLADPDPRVARLAGAALTLAARQPLLSESSGDAEEITQRNREIDQANKVFREWSCPNEEAACLARVRGAWEGWYAEREEQFRYTTLEKAGILFLDTRFAVYWQRLLRLDFGVSVVNHEPVLPQLIGRLKYSVSLSLLSILLAYILAVPIGIYSAVKPGSRLDNVLTLLLFVLYSLPSFFTATVLLKLLSQGTPLQWFPTGGFYSSDAPPDTTLGALADIAWHLALPIATSTSVALAGLSRYARTGVIDVIRADYIRTARAKGLSEPVVILRHAVRNGMIPILTLLGGLLPVLVSGGVVVETVFNIPGMGQYLVDSINQRDYNAVMAILLASSWLTQIGILLSDLSYALVDPRISLD